MHLQLYSVAAPKMRQLPQTTNQLQSCTAWMQPVRVKPGWVQVQKDYFQAPGVPRGCQGSSNKAMTVQHTVQALWLQFSSLAHTLLAFVALCMSVSAFAFKSCWRCGLRQAFCHLQIPTHLYLAQHSSRYAPRPLSCAVLVLPLPTSCQNPAGARPEDLVPTSQQDPSSCRPPLPPVTFVFAEVLSAHGFNHKHNKSELQAANRAIRRCMKQLMADLPGEDGYMCRCHEPDMKYMVVFESSVRAVQWCLLLQVGPSQQLLHMCVCWSAITQPC